MNTDQNHSFFIRVHLCSSVAHSSSLFCLLCASVPRWLVPFRVVEGGGDMASQTVRPRASEVMRSLGLEPDPWQVEVLEGGHPRLLLNCARQAGKSTVVAVLALVEAVCTPGTKVLLVS